MNCKKIVLQRNYLINHLNSCVTCQFLNYFNSILFFILLMSDEYRALIKNKIYNCVHLA